jgi:hypothetical protein
MFFSFLCQKVFFLRLLRSVAQLRRKERYDTLFAPVPRFCRPPALSLRTRWYSFVVLLHAEGARFVAPALIN